MTIEEYRDATASFTAASVLHLRQNSETDEEFRQALERVLQSITNAMANVVLELDRDGVGEKFVEQLGEHFIGALQATVEVLRDFRLRYHEEKDTVN